MKIRQTAVEGRFYPSGKDGIFDQIRSIDKTVDFSETDLHPEQLIGAVLPHAGHIYSGYQTIPFFKLVENLGVSPETYIIVNPNHTGLGLSVAIDDADAWNNSVGDVSVDRELAIALDLPFDRLAHANEHSAEVLIPYLQYYLPENSFSIVPVSLSDQSFTNASSVALKIHKAIQQTRRKTMVIASSDFSHFLSPREGMERDQIVIDEIMSRNAAGVESAVRKHNISVCGYGPIMVLMEFASYIDDNYKVEILARGHSGEVIPSREVVDYISMIMFQ